MLSFNWQQLRANPQQLDEQRLPNTASMLQPRVEGTGKCCHQRFMAEYQLQLRLLRRLQIRITVVFFLAINNWPSAIFQVLAAIRLHIITSSGRVRPRCPAIRRSHAPRRASSNVVTSYVTISFRYGVTGTGSLLRHQSRAISAQVCIPTTNIPNLPGR